MTSLHITHAVRDLDEWLSTFNSRADFRASGGVTSLTVRHSVDDPNFVAVDLNFDTADQARSFLTRLETEVWPSSPHVDGTPTVHVLEAVGAR
jgi:hypothetical protein